LAAYKVLELKKDREVVLAAVQQYWRALEYAAEELSLSCSKTAMHWSMRPRSSRRTGRSCVLRGDDRQAIELTSKSPKLIS
jgi:hypothetical protein